jgi:branched-chain amino acid transport system ATP-binding protein
MDPLLTITDVSLSFAGIDVLSNVTFSVQPGECVGLIGPNGAGKSSLLNCISRTYRQSSGSLRLSGKALEDLRPFEVVDAGVARTFQNIEIASNRTVLRNVLVGAHRRIGASLPAAVLGIGRARSSEVQIEREARALLEELGIGADADRPAGELPYGNRKLVELARALLSHPALLMLDEPVAGSTSVERELISRKISALAEKFALTLIVVEHDVDFVRSVADKIVVLDFGRVIACGTPGDVLSDRAVKRAYVGEFT